MTHLDPFLPFFKSIDDDKLVCELFDIAVTPGQVKAAFGQFRSVSQTPVEPFIESDVDYYQPRSRWVFEFWPGRHAGDVLNYCVEKLNP